MNVIWGIMILIGIVYGTLTGQVEAVSEAVLTSAEEAVELCITMLGVMAFWMGLMEIAKEAGIVQGLCRCLRPLIDFLFPDIPKDHPAREHISMNCAANILGLGWAATPAGLKAMESLAQLEEERRDRSTSNYSERAKLSKAERNQSDKIKSRQWKHSMRVQARTAVPRGAASNEMCTFLILNISSLQLIPVNIIAYRAQYGSVNPTAIVGPAILATMVSTGVAVVFCRIMNKKR